MIPMYLGTPWWLADFSAWRRVTGRMSLDEIWTERDEHQDKRNAERLVSYQLKQRLSA